jgi:hypothetical protein
MAHVAIIRLHVAALARPIPCSCPSQGGAYKGRIQVFNGMYHTVESIQRVIDPGHRCAPHHTAVDYLLEYSYIGYPEECAPRPPQWASPCSSCKSRDHGQWHQYVIAWDAETYLKYYSFCTQIIVGSGSTAIWWPTETVATHQKSSLTARVELARGVGSGVLITGAAAGMKRQRRWAGRSKRTTARP